MVGRPGAEGLGDRRGSTRHVARRDLPGGFDRPAGARNEWRMGPRRPHGQDLGMTVEYA
jgi:hypothetical protein